jgi:hypothetical protein
MLHWFELNCPCFMQPAVSCKVIKEANTIFWLQCVGTWDTYFSRPSTPFLLISNNLIHNGRRIVIKAKSYFSKETRQFSSSNWDCCCADYNDHSQHDMYIRVPSRHHRACSVFKKFVVGPVHYHHVSGARFSQCVLSLKILRPSVRLNLYNNFILSPCMS